MIKKIKHHNDRNNITTKIRFFNMFDIGWYVTKNMGKHRGVLLGVGNTQLHLTFRQWDTAMLNKTYDA
tara:strand:+ start:1016 stop:1219 length:204 start_codon:yes stop_codon:yes gene_type:complete